MSLTQINRRSLLTTAHSLHPIVIIGNKGLTEGVIAEIERALHDHELIKVRISQGQNKTEKKFMTDEIVRLTKAECLRIIGNVLILYKKK